MTTEEKIEHFKADTMKAASTKRNQILAEYSQSLEQQLEEYKKKKQEEAKFQLKVEADRIKRENNKELSNAQLEIRKTITKKQDELKELVFSEVSDLLIEYKKTPEYDSLLKNQIQKSLNFAKGQPLRIYLDPEDSSKKESLETALQTTLLISEYGFQGGTRAVIGDSRILIDNSFATKLTQAKENFTFNGGSLNE